MKKQEFFKLCFAFLMIFTFSMLVIGCGENGESKFQTEKVEGKQPMEGGSNYTNEVEVVRVDTSGSEASQIFPVEDEIQIDEWMLLVKDIKSTLGEMEEVSKQVLQTSEPR